MPGVPAFILKRLYVKGSLSNTLTGWQFTLRNSLGSGFANELYPLRVDGSEDIPLENATFEHGGTDIKFHEVNEENMFGLEMNRSVEIKVAGEQLSAGEHTVEFRFAVPGLGRLGFDFTDDVAGS